MITEQLIPGDKWVSFHYADMFIIISRVSGDHRLVSYKYEQSGDVWYDTATNFHKNFTKVQK